MGYRGGGDTLLVVFLGYAHGWSNVDGGNVWYPLLSVFSGLLGLGYRREAVVLPPLLNMATKN
jgi:hypothetical protein